MYLCMYACMYVCMSCIAMYACMYVCMYDSGICAADGRASLIAKFLRILSSGFDKRGSHKVGAPHGNYEIAPPTSLFSLTKTNRNRRNRQWQ